MQVFQIWKTSGLEDFQTTSRKSSRRLPGSLPTDYSPMSLFHNRSERFGFNQMVLIFHLDIFFRSGFGYAGFSDVEDFWARRLPDDFHEVFQTTSRKSSDGVFNQMVLIFHLDISRKLPGRLPDDFQEVFQTTSKKSSRRLPGSLLTGSSSISSGV
ncbi:hypothetical protein DY000_02011933 [Brassica cretica]|uniref:Uncharacterized protein n=1 Tax=Brassica cretica TaxID=69181 RepID=A0ABQ7CTW1_BRACR|nr:hypothetical protein DY000_02011933 [Brassica cretica]